MFICINLQYTKISGLKKATQTGGLFFVCLFIFLLTTHAQSNEHGILGTWQNEDRSGKIEIYQSGDQYFGKLLWGKYMLDERGVPRKDTLNPNIALRSRAWPNIVMLTGFRYQNGQWEDGKIYDPTSGKSYTAVMKLKNGRLALRGYIGIELLGKTIYWDRVK
ncbi:DUF2147 domain-containing protein [Chitinophaga sp. 22321]|uniref:DUF2147 domain-containing protein n=1 Tax=Chitinophaga hostae TaxID=2831022 RepID=A0ABS5J794_9BACT|nr:DUF2147 domain-containing protein [Chitinophaga hostae]MBS0031064.1 DUF2147 domain-containing protein [Chitinophaga hostae]